MFKGALSRLAKMGGHDLALELLDRFLIEGPQRLEQASLAFQQGERQALQHHLHRICSDAGWLGASDVQELARGMEVQAESGPLEGFSELLEQLSQLCYQACVLLEQEKRLLCDPEYRPSKEGQPAAQPKADA